MLLHSHTCRQTWSKTWVLASRTLSPKPSQRREGLELQGDCLLNPPPALKPSPTHPQLHTTSQEAGTSKDLGLRHAPRWSDQKAYLTLNASPLSPYWEERGAGMTTYRKDFSGSTLEGHWNTLARWTEAVNFTDLPCHRRQQGRVPAASCSLATKDFSFSKYKLS